MLNCEKWNGLTYFSVNYKAATLGTILRLIKKTACLLGVLLSFMGEKLRCFCKYFIVSDTGGHHQFTLTKIHKIGL